MKSRVRIGKHEYAICSASGGCFASLVEGTISKPLRDAFLADEPAAETPSARLLRAVDGLISDGHLIRDLRPLTEAREAMKAEPAPVEGPDPYEQRLIRQLRSPDRLMDYPPDCSASNWNDHPGVRYGFSVALGMYREAREKGQIQPVQREAERLEDRVSRSENRILDLEHDYVSRSDYSVHSRRLDNLEEAQGGGDDVSFRELLERVQDLEAAQQPLGETREAIAAAESELGTLRGIGNRLDGQSSRIEKLESEVGALRVLVPPGHDLYVRRLADQIERVEKELAQIAAGYPWEALVKAQKELELEALPERAWTLDEILSVIDDDMGKEDGERRQPHQVRDDLRSAFIDKREGGK